MNERYENAVLRSEVTDWLDRDGVSHEWGHEINPSSESLYLQGLKIRILTSTLEDNPTKAIVDTLRQQLPRLIGSSGTYTLGPDLQVVTK